MISSATQSVATLPLTQRCAQLETFLNKSTLKDVYNELPTMLEAIFGFGTEEGWRLDEVSRSYSSYTFDVLRRFLSPSGVLFKVIQTLQQDPNMLFDFPISCLPNSQIDGLPVLSQSAVAPVSVKQSRPPDPPNVAYMNGYGREDITTQNSIEDGSMSQFIANRLHLGTNGRPLLLLNAFELYMFHFAYYLVNPQHQRTHTQWHNLQECLYPVVLEDYQSHFLPLTPRNTPTSSPLVHSTPHLRHSPLHHSPSLSPIHSGSLLRHSVIATRQQTHAIGHDPQNSELSQSDSFIQIFAELWLGQIPTAPSSSHLSTSFETSLPSTNLILVLRSFIKYLHYFTNSAEPVPVSSMYHQPTVNPWDEFKRNSYITENLLFYTVLFQEFLQRIQRVDLTSPFHAYMLFRLTKVFGQKNLKTLLERAENCVTDPDSKGHNLSDIGASYLSSQQTVAATVSSQLQELESSAFSYQLLFGGATVRQVDEVIQQALDATQKVTRDKTISNQRRGGWLSWFLDDDNAGNYGDVTATEIGRLQQHLDAAVHHLCAMFEVGFYGNYGDVTATVIERLQQHLDAAVHHLCAMFELPMNVYETINRTSDLPCDSTMLNESQIASPNSPQCTTVNGALQLTDVGRKQVVNGVRKFDVIFRGDPDLLPIRGHENATLVRLLHQLSQFVNTKYGDKILSLYECDNFIGRMTQVCFSPAVPPEQVVLSPISVDQQTQLSRPRLSLRALASYRKIMIFVLFFLIMRLLFGVDVVKFILLVGMMFLICVIFKAMLRSIDTKVA